MTKTIKNLGQAARYGMFIKVTCRNCAKVATFTSIDLAGVLGHGRPISSLSFRCRDCNSTDCEVVPFEESVEMAPRKKRVWRPVLE